MQIIFLDAIVVKTRKRLRQPYLHKKFIEKQKVEQGKARITKGGRKIAEKIFKSKIICKCSKECPKKVDIMQQKSIFETYYNDCSWTPKTLFIRSSVKTKDVQKKKSVLFPIIASKKRMFNYEYNLQDSHGISQQVCRHFFVNCLQVTPTRINHALKTAIKNPSAKESRGSSAPVNKTNETQKDQVKQFINSIPAYESHYGRKETQKKYLHHNLNIIKLYREYCSIMEFRQLNAVSEHIFREIFNTEFNLCFKRRHTDTCKCCDEFDAKMSSSIVPENAKKEIEKQKKNHLDLVETTNRSFREDVEHAIDSMENIFVLTFDLQKTLETPSITTSVAFYKRQLWTYNLCIYDEVDKKGQSYVINRIFCLKRMHSIDIKKRLFIYSIYVYVE